MARTSISFVRVERLRLQLFYVEAEKLFRVHERWLSQEGAASELGLSGHIASDDLVLHTAKVLFDEALQQLSQKAPTEGEYNTGTPNRRVEATRAHQRVLEYQHMGKLTVHRHSETAPELALRRTYISREGNDVEIEVQCHRAK